MLFQVRHHNNSQIMFLAGYCTRDKKLASATWGLDISYHCNCLEYSTERLKITPVRRFVLQFNELRKLHYHVTQP